MRCSRAGRMRFPVKDNRLALVRWMIRSIDGDAYRAGRLQGMKHPSVDGEMIEAAGGLTSLIDQIEELEREGLLRAEWYNLRADVRKIEYPVSVMPELCRRAGIEDPRKRQLRHIAQIEVYQEAIQGTFLEVYYQSILRRLEEGREVKNPDIEDERFFRCLNAIALSGQPEWRPAFSNRVLGDSKLFKNQ